MSFKNVKGYWYRQDQDVYTAYVHLNGKQVFKTFRKGDRTKEEALKEALAWREEMMKVKEETVEVKKVDAKRRGLASEVEEPFEAPITKNIWTGQKGRSMVWFGRILENGVKKTVTRSIAKYGNKGAYDLIAEMVRNSPASPSSSS